MSVKLLLPTIPEPKKGEKSVLIPGEGFQGPYFKGDGSIDLHCGSCSTPLAVGMYTGSIKEIVLKCPNCGAFNAIVDIPKIERFFSQILGAEVPKNGLPKLKKIVSTGLDRESPYEYVAEQIESSLPELGWVKDYLVPTNAGETYAMLAFIAVIVTFLLNRRKTKDESNRTIINNFYSFNNPYRNVGKNAQCPCGSGKKFKHCHGSSDQNRGGSDAKTIH